MLHSRIDRLTYLAILIVLLFMLLLADVVALVAVNVATRIVHDFVATFYVVDVVIVCFY